MRIHWVVTCALNLVVLVSGDVAFGQRVEALSGQPFGVATVTLPASVKTKAALELNELEIRGGGHRALYPTFTLGRVRQLLGELLGNGPTLGGDQLSASFLFTGNEPFQITIHTPDPVTVVVRPRAPLRRAHDRMLMRWWRQYNADVRERLNAGDYPPLVETYLTSMLARRMGLSPPLLTRLTEDKPSEPMQTVELLMGLESLHMSTIRDSMRSVARGREQANNPLPPGVRWGEPITPKFQAEIPTEPMAKHVPAECFYVRFGSFANYLWMNKLLEEYGGDISGMVTLRGNNPRLTQKVQTQLAVEQNMASELFGDQVIRDVALLGRDLYLSEGAALGVMFQAFNTSVLKLNLDGQRQVFQRKFAKQGATLEKIKIGDHDASFLSTPDNLLRSFYVVDGEFHLITTSREVARRFFEAGAGKQSLSMSAGFRHARSVLPLTREDTIFVYFSDAFMRGLVSPQYQIELGRRMQAATDLELVMLARLAARAERQPADTIEQLSAGGFLPRQFTQRPDRSGPILEASRAIDSLRGQRGSFTPIPDVDIRGVTDSELNQYNERANYYSQEWRQMDPLMVGVKRFALDKKGKERVVIDAHVSPFVEEKYGWIMSMVGPPNAERITSAPGDIITVQAMLRGGLLSPSIPPHHIYLGIQDTAPLPTEGPGGLLETFQLLRTTPGYLGGWPKPGFLDLLPFGIGGAADASGYAQLPFGLVRWQGNGHSILSFDRDVLAHVAPHLKPEQSDDSAQIRIHVGDVSASKLVPWVKSLTYNRASKASMGNVRLLNALTQQLNVAREESQRTAERLLDTELVCSLGGKYELKERNGDMYWTSEKWSTKAEEFDAPVLKWFRGLDAGLTKYGDRLVLRATVDMQRQPDEPAISLPLFNLFGGGKSPPKEKRTPAKPEPLN